MNALVALAWDSHVHHSAIRAWFTAHAGKGWASCSVTESGFVRVSSNRHALPSSIPVSAAIEVLARLRTTPGHHFLADNVSLVDPDLPAMGGYRQVTDAHLLTLARRHGIRLVTFDRGIAVLADGRDVELLHAL